MLLRYLFVKWKIKCTPSINIIKANNSPSFIFLTGIGYCTCWMHIYMHVLKTCGISSTAKEPKYIPLFSLFETWTCLPIGMNAYTYTRVVLYIFRRTCGIQYVCSVGFITLHCLVGQHIYRCNWKHPHRSGAGHNSICTSEPYISERWLHCIVCTGAHLI